MAPQAPTTSQSAKTPTTGRPERGFLRDVGETFGSRLFMLAGAFLIGLITLRVLGPEGRGVFVVVAVFFEIAAIVASLGLGQANVYFTGRRVETEKIFANSVFAAAFMGVFSAGAILIGRNYFQTLMPKLDPRFLVAVALIMPARLLLVFTQHIFLGRNWIKDYNRLRNVEVFAQLLLLALFVPVLGLGVIGAVTAFFAGGLVALGFSLFKLRKYVSFRVDFNQLRLSLVFGFKTYLTEISQFLNFRLDMFLVAVFLNFRQAGYYSAAVALAQVLWNLPFALGTVLFSRSASSEETIMDLLTPRACRIILIIVICCAALLAVFGGQLIGFLFGDAYKSALRPLWLLLPGIVAFSIHQVLYTDLAGRGRPEVGTIASLIALIFTVGLDLILIPKYGISGAALATSCSYTVGAFYVLRSYSAVTGIAVKRILVPEWDDLRWLRLTFAGLIGRRLAESDNNG